MSDGQRVSWFDQHGQNHSKTYAYGVPKHPGLVASIFFPTDSSDLDDDDCAALDALVNNLKYRLLVDTPMRLQMVGYADPRGTDAYNMSLGMRRASSVKRYVDDEMRAMHSGNYSSMAQSQGERHPTGSWAYDRRVDVFSSYVPKRPTIVLDPVTVPGRYDGPLSDKFKFRTMLGSSVGMGPLAAQALTIQIQNSRTGRVATYTYTGSGPGLNFGINRPTDWDEKTVPVWLDVDDFEGNGRVGSAGVIYGGTVFVFEGPKERGKSSESISVAFDGWDLNVGFEGDAVGYWHRR
jgi:hypothetical protein